MKAGRVSWQDRLRPQRLQIDEICEAGAEFLAARKIKGLRHFFLPSGLKVHVSLNDFRSLRPFERDLSKALEDVMRELEQDSSVHALTPRLRIELCVDPTRREGCAPHFTAGFPKHGPVGKWSQTSTAEASGPVTTAAVFDLVITTGSHDHTGVEEGHRVALGAFPDKPDAGDRIAVENPFILPVDGIACPGAGQRHILSARRVLQGPGDAEVLWGQDGALLIGRDPTRSHLVPAHSSAFLSRCQFAIVLDDTGSVRVVDLASSNGTRVNGAVCLPYEAVPLKLPTLLEIGDSGMMRIDLRAASEATTSLREATRGATS